MLRTALNPDLYHGHKRSRNFFEGWYFKLVDPSEHYVFAFIPGILRGKIPEHSHSFIHLVDGRNAFMHYLRQPVDAFAAVKNKFSLRVGENRFSLHGLELAVRESEFSISGKVGFTQTKKWPGSFLNPGSMGFYNFLPGMQCYSQVCAMDSVLEGNLEINGRRINFDGGRGYIEKNWGRAFPYSWIWIQANNFAQPGVALSCSLGHISFLGTSFRGFLIGLQVGDRFFNFSTMNRSRMQIEQTDNDVWIQVLNRNHRLVIEAQTNAEHSVLLNGPRDGKMVPLVRENLQGEVGIKLSEANGRQVLAARSACAGVEYGGQRALIAD